MSSVRNDSDKEAIEKIKRDDCFILFLKLYLRMMPQGEEFARIIPKMELKLELLSGTLQKQLFIFGTDSDTGMPGVAWLPWNKGAQTEAQKTVSAILKKWEDEKIITGRSLHANTRRTQGLLQGKISSGERIQYSFNPNVNLLECIPRLNDSLSIYNEEYHEKRKKGIAETIETIKLFVPVRQLGTIIMDYAALESEAIENIMQNRESFTDENGICTLCLKDIYNMQAIMFPEVVPALDQQPAVFAP